MLNPVREAPKPLLRKQRRATAVHRSPPVFETELLFRLDRIECCCIAVSMLCATSPPPTLESTNIAQETLCLVFGTMASESIARRCSSSAPRNAWASSVPGDLPARAVRLRWPTSSGTAIPLSVSCCSWLPVVCVRSWFHLLTTWVTTDKRWEEEKASGRGALLRA